MTAILPTIAAHARAAQNGDLWVLIPPAETGEVLVVNGTGYEIFRRCDGTRSKDEIVEMMAAEAAVDVEAVEADVAEFIARLAEAGVLAE